MKKKTMPPKSMGCQLDECGKTSCGLRVRAITDSMGSQVVVTDDADPKKDSLLSQPLEDHRTAIKLGKEIAKFGISCYKKWRGPVDTLFESAMIAASPQNCY